MQWRANFGRSLDPTRRKLNPWLRDEQLDGLYRGRPSRRVAQFIRETKRVSPLGNLSSRVASRGRCPVHAFQRSYRPCLTYPSSRFARLINSMPSEIRNSLLLREEGREHDFREKRLRGISEFVFFCEKDSLNRLEERSSMREDTCSFVTR